MPHGPAPNCSTATMRMSWSGASITARLPDARASTASASRREASSIIAPSSSSAARPSRAASSSAPISRRAAAISAADGENARLHASIWPGWITHLPTKPRSLARRAVSASPSRSRKAANGPSTGSIPLPCAATAIRERA